jgi:hypothetical protein
MRLSCISNDVEEKKQLQDFAEWILDIGDGKHHQMRTMN